jgi:HEAT repeat protein
MKRWLKCLWLSWMLRVRRDPYPIIVELERHPTIKAAETLFDAYRKHQNPSDPLKIRYAQGLDMWAAKMRDARNGSDVKAFMDRIGKRYGAEGLILLFEGRVSSDLKLSTANALGALKDARAVQPLLLAAQDGRNTVLQRVAINALESIGDPDIAPPLSTLLTSLLNKVKYESFRDWYGYYSSEGSVLAILEALNKIGGPEAVDSTLEAFRSAVDAVKRFSDVRVEVTLGMGGRNTFAQELVNVAGRQLIDLLSRDSHPNAHSILSEIAGLSDLEFYEVLVEHRPGDSEYEQIYKDGYGPSTRVTRVIVKFEKLASMAREAVQSISA